MLSMNRRIPRDVSHDDTTWLRRLKLKFEKVFNWQISRSWKLLVEITFGLDEEGSCKINEQEDERESAFDRKIDLWSQNVGIGWE